MSDHCDAQTMLLYVLGVSVAHQPPPADELHSGKICEQMTHLELSSWFGIGSCRLSNRSSRTANPCRSYKLRLRGDGHKITASIASCSQKRRQTSISIDPRPALRFD